MKDSILLLFFIRKLLETLGAHTDQEVRVLLLDALPNTDLRAYYPIFVQSAYFYQLHQCEDMSDSHLYLFWQPCVEINRLDCSLGLVMEIWKECNAHFV